MRFLTRRNIAGLMCLLLVVIATTLFAQAGRGSAHATTVKLVSDMLERYHINHVHIDDDASKQLFERFIEQLDPLKVYFLQDDIEQFRLYETSLDNMLDRGDASFAYEIYDKYLSRIDERMAYAQELVDSDFDFTKNEEIATDPDTINWARTTAEIHERWRKRVKSDYLDLKLDDKTDEDIRDRLHKRYRNVQLMRTQVDDEEILESYLTALSQVFDPHSSFMSKSTLEDFRISMELSLEGIGAALRFEDGYTTVAEIVAGGAAEKDGRLKVGDVITGVAQAGESDFVDIVEMKLTKVVRLIRGDSGTKVKLQVKTKTGESKIYELTRQKIELKSSAVRGEIIDSAERFGTPGTRVGVINIPSFYRDFRGAQAGVEGFRSTSRDVLMVLEEFRQAGGVDLVVVDLRTNGGGALAEAIEVTGLFIEKGPVVQVKEQDGNIRSHEDTDEFIAYTGPLVVLCNRLSASASEIFAAAIRDYDRGIVIGDTTTHGKGTVQNVMPVPPRLFRFLNRDGQGALKLTIQQFYRVNGDSTQTLGVKSDVVLPSLLDHLDLGEQFLDNSLAFSEIDAAEGRSALGLVPEGVVSKLRHRSAARIAGNEEFAKLNDDIIRLLERKDRKTRSLNEAVRKAEKEQDVDPEDDPEKKEEEKEESVLGSNGPIFEANYYNDEVLNIGIDYVKLLNEGKVARK
ncbi:carboxy terminal-processing peptidase [Calycomorphotria hydatis]|uniref:Tail-specific protease n=1 Tax=Calycomorphotria hydatis TaxID=2528027 RepID=A0A517TD19_9PLAN|nr:carboxy terminal-processing peptidase [Calycomorphotria hydatis]QDT66271.1 Tail-specific protease precursor [Calycomorphotria hydatis]